MKAKNSSIQVPHVASDPVLDESVGVSTYRSIFIIFHVGPIPADLGFHGNEEVDVFYFEGKGVGEDLGDQGLFKLLLVLEENRIVDLKKRLNGVSSPQGKEDLINFIGSHGLWLEGNGFTDHGFIVRAAEEVPTTTKESRD